MKVIKMHDQCGLPCRIGRDELIPIPVDPLAETRRLRSQGLVRPEEANRIRDARAQRKGELLATRDAVKRTNDARAIQNWNREWVSLGKDTSVSARVAESTARLAAAVEAAREEFAQQAAARRD